MAIIDAKGLFLGERINGCSDEAQLHWHRFFTASNTYGRLELNYQKIITVAYGGFRQKPTEDQVMGWLQEYAENFLLFIYPVGDGSFWGQWLTPDEYLRDYHTAEDNRSPVPPEKQLEAYRRRYVAKRRDKLNRFNSILKPSETVSNHSNSVETALNHTEPSETISISPIGEGEGKGEKKSAFEDFAAVGRDEEPITPHMIAQGVCQILKVSYNRVTGVVMDEICKAELDDGADPTELRDRMVKAWRDYQKAKPKLVVHPGLEKFFGEGYWRNPEGWSWKPGTQPTNGSSGKHKDWIAPNDS
jgi:hypothetical protein